MKIVIIGATGFIGRALTARLQREGHHVAAVVRDLAKARAVLGDEVGFSPMAELDAAIRGSDAVVNLAGENILSERWTARRVERLWASRVDLTRRLVAAIRDASRRPRVLVSASAVGFYGDAGERLLVEGAPSGSGTLAELCAAWEDAASEAADLGVRTVVPRIGVVLGPEGGAWPSLRAAFASGFGGTLGSGRQWFPWIHLDDAVEILAESLVRETWRGPINVSAPRVVTNAELSRVIGERLGRRTGPRLLEMVVRLALGRRAEAVLSSQRVEPRFLEDAGFAFRYPELGGAVDALLDLEESVQITPASGGLEHVRGDARPHYTLRQVTEIDAGVDEVFGYFSRAQNLGPMTPAWTQFRFVGAPPGPVHDGMTIDYRIKLGPVPLRWRTSIARWLPTESFVDVQVRGPYRLWWHEHRFEAAAGRTRMTDTVHYALPFGPVGRLVHRLFVAPTLKRIFGFRRAAIARRFSLRHQSLRSAA